MHCLTAWGQWAVELLQCTAPLPGGIGQCNFCNTLPHCLGAAGSATPAMHCLTALGQWAAELLQCTASLPGSSGQCNSCNAVPHCLGAVGTATPAMGGRNLVPGLWGCTTGRTGLGGWGVQPRGWSGHPSGPMGGHHLWRTGRTGLGGTGSPAQGVFGVSCQGQWGAIFFREPGAPARGGRGVLPRGCSESPARPMGGHLLQRTGRTSPGGTGSPAQGVFGVCCQAKGGPSSSENRAQRPGGDGKSCPGGVRSLLPGQWGAILPAGGAGFLLFAVGSGLRAGSGSFLFLCSACAVLCWCACAVALCSVLSCPRGTGWCFLLLHVVFVCLLFGLAVLCCLLVAPGVVSRWCAVVCPWVLCCAVLLRVVPPGVALLCAVLFRFAPFGAAARCVVSLGAVLRLGVLCLLAPCFVLSPRAVCVLLWCVAAWCCSPLCFVPCAPWGVVLCVSCRLRPVRCCCVARSPSVPCFPVLCPVVLCCRLVPWCPVLPPCWVCFLPGCGCTYFKNRCKIS